MWTIYQHTRGLLYLHLGTALHSESCEPMEIYRTLYDNDLAPVWARPQAMFHEEVTPGQKRFTEVGRVRLVPLDDKESHSLDSARQHPVARLHRDVRHYATRYLYELPSGELQAQVTVFRLAPETIGIDASSIGIGHEAGIALVRSVIELARCENRNMQFIVCSESAWLLCQKVGLL